METTTFFPLHTTVGLVVGLIAALAGLPYLLTNIHDRLAQVATGIIAALVATILLVALGESWAAKSEIRQTIGVCALYGVPIAAGIYAAAAHTLFTTAFWRWHDRRRLRKESEPVCPECKRRSAYR